MASMQQCVAKLVEGLCHAFTGEAAARGYHLRMVEALKSAEQEIRVTRQQLKEATEDAEKAKEALRAEESRASAAEGRAKHAEARAQEAIFRAGTTEDALREANEVLAAAQSEHALYLETTLPGILESARTRAVEDYLQFEDFKVRMAAQYRDGTRDMKAGFNLYNPNATGLDWSFIELSEETVAGEPEDQVPEEGEVTGGARLEDLIILDDQNEPEVADQPAVAEAAPADHPTVAETAPAEQSAPSGEQQD